MTAMRVSTGFDGTSDAGMMPYGLYAVPPTPGYHPYAYYTSQPLPLQPVAMESPRAAATKTLLITSFPDDVKERELNNLLLFIPGYQASIMMWGPHGVEGRAAFATPDQAREALARLDGVAFDAGHALKAVLAPEELEVEVGLPAAAVDEESPSHAKSTSSGEAATSAVGSPTAAAATGGGVLPHPPGTVPVAYGGGGVMPYPTPYAHYAPAGPHHPAAVLPPHRYAPVKNERDNPACNTLFIGNLGDGVAEEELRAVFATQPGFQQLKVVRSPRGTSAFVEFADVATAAAAHDTQQGLILNSSDRGPIRVQYSKNPFGRKREGGGLGGPGGMSVGIGGVAPPGLPPPPPGAPAGMTAAPAMYGAYAVPVPQPMMSAAGYIYSASPPGTSAVFPAAMVPGVPAPAPPPRPPAPPISEG